MATIDDPNPFDAVDDDALPPQSPVAGFVVAAVGAVLAAMGIFGGVFASSAVPVVLGTFVGVTSALVGMFLAMRAGIEGPRFGFWHGTVASLAIVSGSGWFLFGGFLSLLALNGFRRGRQLRKNGALTFAPMTDGDAWADGVIDADAPPELRRSLAAAWRENGRTEHASVAAFARVSLELIALGAPPKLLTDTAQDTIDEISHAERCFALARALDGVAESPGAFEDARTAGTLRGTRTMRLVALAVTSLIDGALHEGLSARVLADLSPGVQIPAVRQLLKDLARDEGRHSAHGWDVVEWCLEVGGEPVRQALRAAIRALPATVDGDGHPDAADGGWERFGLVGKATEQAHYEAARAHLVHRVEALVA